MKQCKYCTFKCLKSTRLNHHIRLVHMDKLETNNKLLSLQQENDRLKISLKEKIQLNVDQAKKIELQQEIWEQKCVQMDKLYQKIDELKEKIKTLEKNNKKNVFTFGNCLIEEQDSDWESMDLIV